MMNILQLLENKTTNSFLSYKELHLSRADFAEQVDKYFAIFRENGNLQSKDPVLLFEQHPIWFYVYLFALWKNGNVVVFPTRDLLDKKTQYTFYRYILQIHGENLEISENSEFFDFQMDEKIDTILFSSGSTGTPKGIQHHRDHFIQNAMAVHERLGMEQYTSITPLKPFLVSAVSHFLVHYLAQSHLIFIEFADIKNIAEFYDNNSQIAIVGSPMHLIAAMPYMKDSYRPKYFFSSGDFIYANTIASIFTKFPDALFFKVYGLTEVAGRFFVKKLDKHSAIEEYEAVGECIAGTRSKVEGNKLFMQSDFQFFAYITNETQIASQEWHDTGDLVMTNPQGHLCLYGRSDDEIKIGGQKVSTKHLEMKISRILPDDVAIIVLKQHSLLGHLLCLCVKSQNNYSRKDLITKLREGGLDKHEIPHEFYAIEEIMYTQTMKIDRKRIQQNLDNLAPIR